MPLVSRSADRGRHRSERAPHGRLMDVKNSQNSYPTLSETNQKKEKKMSFFILLSFFAIRNLDHLSCVVQYLFKLFLEGGLGIHLICVDFSQKCPTEPTHWCPVEHASAVRAEVSRLRQSRGRIIKFLSSSRIPTL